MGLKTTEWEWSERKYGSQRRAVSVVPKDLYCKRIEDIRSSSYIIAVYDQKLQRRQPKDV